VGRPFPQEARDLLGQLTRLRDADGGSGEVRKPERRREPIEDGPEDGDRGRMLCVDIGVWRVSKSR
jgi:hypothetical protein